MNDDRLNVKEKLAYGLGDFAINIAYTTIGFYFLFFMVNVAALPAEWAGIIFFIARAWDAITDPLMGIISDRTKSKYGRRRIYFLIGVIPFAFFFMLIWFVPFESKLLSFLYYTCITILFNTSFTVVAVPYNAMMPELSQNYDERTSISGYRMSLSFAGNLVAAVGVSLIVDVIFGGKQFYKIGYMSMGIIFAIIMAISILITFFGTEERVKGSSSAEQQNILATFKSILSLKEFRIILGMFLFNMIGFDLIQAIFIFFLKDVIKLSEDFTFIVMGVPLIVAIIAAPLWLYISNKLNKKKAYIIAATYFILVLLLCLIAPEKNLYFVLLIAAFAGIGISASQIIPFSIIPDIVEYDEYINGVRREGAFYGLTTFLYKVASASAIAITSKIIGYFGYIEGGKAIQPESAILSIRYLMSFAPGICFLISILFISKFSITREKFNEIKLKIQNNRANMS